MKSRIILTIPFLFFSIPVHAENSSIKFNFQGEVGLIIGNFKGSYKREKGYEKWNGKNTGFIYKLDVENLFKLRKDTEFKLSVISGNTKAPYVSLFSSREDKLFDNSIRTFNIKELYFKKEYFIFNNLTLTAGKQLFSFSPLLSDYLWGGKFTYRLSDSLSFVWNQIAGYEGKYLLFNNEEEDDIDAFGPSLELKRGFYDLNFSFLKISDARGTSKGINKNAFLGMLSYQLNRNSSFFFSGAIENGKPAIYSRFDYDNFRVSAGYSNKNFTSYGFKEGIREIGFLYRPSFSGIQFLKVSYAFSLSEFDFKIYGLHLENTDDKLIGNEIGGEVDYPFFNGALFLQTAIGKDGAYAFYSGYRWDISSIRHKYNSFNLDVKNYFNIVGEYGDFSQKIYRLQNGYEEWEGAKHVGFWHSTYKLTLKSDNLKVKISTGKDSKVDYVIWGNTADNFLYNKTHRKLWHFEKLSYKKKDLTLGLQGLTILGFISENLTGISFNRELSGGYFFEQNGKTLKGSTNFHYLYLSVPYKSFEFSYLYRTNKREFNSVYALSYKNKFTKLGYLKEYGTETNNSWGGFLSVKAKIYGNKIYSLYRVYSKTFRTFGLKEYFRNDGYIYRPGESNVRFAKLTVSRKLKIGLKQIDRLKPEIKLLYDRLSQFSGSYVGEEGGIIISLKPGNFCKLSLIGTIGNNNSYYEGLRFDLKW
ncbi:hypothetical protein GFV12_01805 [Desulfurobacterium thermolithotrophum]|uniref:hypothetical protein n=1 Tax=Desulfurobacterium thermolithotrophum TaxID=64160 RepID=UPI0013D3BDE6|nr:hypothetical protein [Desulfurobacterium thermolithotrophum]